MTLAQFSSVVAFPLSILLLGAGVFWYTKKAV